MYTMKDIFDQKVMCSCCDIKTSKNFAIKNGFKIRILECPKCGDVLYHPGDMKEYDDYKKLKKQNFSVKLRMVGNSFCVSIPKELIDFHNDMENEFNNLVRLNLEGPGKIGLFFVRRKLQ